MLWHKHRTWALSVVLSLLLGSFTCSTKVATLVVDPPRNSTGLTDTVQWDNYTLFVNDQRVFLYSGEFHTFRLPVPDLWLDIFQKMVAAGMNGVSIYLHWGFSNPAPGVTDFNDWRALQPMFDAAKTAGIFIVLRPGPYINAETSAGGIPLWVTSRIAAPLRTSAEDYQNAWTPYIEGIKNATVPNQVSNGGPVIAVQIDNEYASNLVERQDYFVQVESLYREGGIVVPFTYNDPGPGRSFINGTGSVDIYGMDAYPARYDCGDPYIWHPVPTGYHQYHDDVNPSQPWYLPEYQGGAPDGWGGVGYDGCLVLTGADYEDVFYKQNWASNAKMINYYMVYGGTSWGGMPYPGVYTSYDYGAAIRESRALSSKFDELKRQSLFLRSSPQFRKTDWVGETNTTLPGVTVNGTDAYVTFLRNPDSGTGFFVIRQNDTTSTETIRFSLTVPTSRGALKLPQTFSSIEINGRQSKILVTDYAFGSKSSVLFSTAGIFFAGTIGTRDVLFLFGDEFQSHEVALTLTGHADVKSPQSRIKFNAKQISKGVTTVSIHPGAKGLVTIYQSDTQLILFSDPVTAASFWAPAVVPTTGTFKNYWQFGSNTTVLVGGPYLVRNATISGSGELALRGDLNTSTPLTIVAPSSVKSVSWNGKRIPVQAAIGSNGHRSSAIQSGLLSKQVSPEAIKVPSLNRWKFQNSLPEVELSFSDVDWIVANHTTTNVTQKPLFGDGRVLYGCDYGFCEGVVLWRGHFNATGSEKSVNLTINGGTAFAASIWINDHFINSTAGGSAGNNTNAVYTFPKDSVRVGQDNVITVVQDNMGNDEFTPEPRSPRGIPGFQLDGGTITEWKVQGKLGGYTDFPDRTRGISNEGGLYGERQGWHLPDFDISSWTTRSLSQGLPNGAGVGFFVTTFELDIPKGTDALMSFMFEKGITQAYRAILFVNGWHFGRRLGNLGPQYKFPVHQGILNYNGKNTVAVALWALDNTRISPSLQLTVDEVLDGGVGPIRINNPPWSRRD